MPGVDVAAARDGLDQVLSRVATDESRASYYVRRLVAYLEYRAGVSPLDPPGDPVSVYGELRDKASTAVHDELSLAEAETMLARTVAWFIRVFTPPDQVAEAIRTLAAQPWSGPEQITELKRLATVDHHLRLFFSEITDPAWLEPLHQAGVAHLPSRNALWPVAALPAGLGKTSPESVAALLKCLLVDTAAIAKHERAAARFELLRIATQLDPPAHGVVVEVVRQHSDVPSVRSLSVNAALKADAADSAVLDVADAVLNHFRRFGDADRYHAVTILDQLQAGVTADNVADRKAVVTAHAGNRAGGVTDPGDDRAENAVTPHDLPPRVETSHAPSGSRAKRRWTRWRPESIRSAPGCRPFATAWSPSARQPSKAKASSTHGPSWPPGRRARLSRGCRRSSPRPLGPPQRTPRSSG